MDDAELRKLLEELHAEIEGTRNVDEEGRELLRHLGRDIAELLARSEGAPVQPSPARAQRLQDGIARFEVSHPALTRLLADLLETLSNAGV
jgi:hypothetical protein